MKDNIASTKKITSGATTSHIGFVNGRPTIFVNGEPISHALYCDPCARPGITGENDWRERIRDFVDSGLRLFTVTAYRDDVCWGGSGENCVPLDRQVEIILEMQPEAWIIVRFGDYLPPEWYDQNPRDVQQPSLVGPKYRQEPSLASEKGLNDLCDYTEKMVRYCESSLWVNKIIGYFCYPKGEGISTLSVGGFFFDQSEVTQEAFKAWVRRNYKDEASLRSAWGEADITFDTVRVPTDEEWRAQIEKDKNLVIYEILDPDEEKYRGVKQELFHWIEGDQLRKMRDYLALQRELYMRWYKTYIRRNSALFKERPVFLGIDMAKQTMMGWQHNLAFHGIGPGAEFINMISASGGIDIGELLDEPGLSLLVTPADYTARTVGYGWESEGSSESMKLRGKAVFVENDCRTFNEGQQDHHLGAFRDEKELRAGMLRNFAWSLSRGQMDYWMIAGAGYFHNQKVQEKGVRAVRPLIDKSRNYPHIETEHAIAMIIDDASPMYENGTSGYQNLAVLWQRVIGLAHCGVPYRVYLFSDLAKENMPDYRCYLFPNMFKLDEEKMAILRSKTLRDGRVSIFGPSTGITDGVKLSGEWASRLFGIKMDMIKKECYRRVIVNRSCELTRRLPSSMVYGDSRHFGPILIPRRGEVEAGGGQVLGDAASVYFDVNDPGLFVKDFGGEYKIAWSYAVPLPGCLLRELARYGGCNVWCEEDDVILASGSIAAIHSVKDGSRTIRLPGRKTVYDVLTDEKIGEGLDEINIEIASPDTRIFYME